MATTITTRPAMPTVSVHPRSWRGDLRATREALLSWFETVCRTQYGYGLDGHEIYWLSAVGPADGLVHAGDDPALSVGLRHGGNEGWILTISANVKLSHQGGKGCAYLPILRAKVWSPDAGCHIGAAVMRAALDAFQPAKEA